MKKTSLIFIFGLLITNMSLQVNGFSFSDNRVQRAKTKNVALKALASIEAYKQWSENQKQLTSQTDGEKIDKIEKIQKKANETLQILNDPERFTEHGDIKTILGVTQAEIATARDENSSVLAKVNWSETGGEAIILQDIENKRKIVQEWERIDLIVRMEDMAYEWSKGR